MKKGKRLGKIKGGPWKGKTAYIADDTRVRELRHEIDLVLEAIEHEDAMVTDLSSLSDFELGPLEYTLAEDFLGLKFKTKHDRLVDIAQRLRDKDLGR